MEVILEWFKKNNHDSVCSNMLKYFYWYFQVCFEIAVFLVPHLSHPDSFIIPPYSILMYTQSSLWFFLMLIDRFVNMIKTK